MTKRIPFLLKVFLAAALGVFAITFTAVPAAAQFGGISYGVPTTCPGYPTFVIDVTNNVVYSCGSSGAPVYVGNAAVITKVLSEGACTGAAAGVDVLCADASLHAFKSSLNNGSFVAMPQLAGDLGNTAASPQVTATHLAAPLPVAQGGTGIASGTSGGILAYTAAGTLASSVALTANVLMKGGGAGVAPGNSSITDDGVVVSNSEPVLMDANAVYLTADWTCGTGGTVASCTSATIVGSGGGVPLTFTLPLEAKSWTWECDGVVGQATAATANQWNILTATNGATNVTATYDMYTAATAKAAGAVTDQASTTTTFQIAPSWTLGGTATKMPFHIWGRVQGASASGTVLSLQILAPTVGDLVTIYQGAGCRIR